MYTDGVGRKRDDGKRKEYTISEVAYHLGCDSDSRTKTLNREKRKISDLICPLENVTAQSFLGFWPVISAYPLA